MEHTLENLLQFSSRNLEDPKHERIQGFHYDHSGHVVTTNSHVLFASRKPWEIQKAGRTFSKSEYEKGVFTEVEQSFPKWQEVIPEECGRKVSITIPSWFSLFGENDQNATMVLDYSDTSNPFFKISKTIGETCLGFNAKYLSCFAGQEVCFLIKSHLSPVIIVNKDSSLDPYSKHFKESVLKEEWFYILMPIKLDKELLNEVYI